MSETAVLLDAFTRVNESLHRMLIDLTDDELTKEPHPSIGWLAWRLSRVIDNNASRLAGFDQLWVANGWAERFGMEPRCMILPDRRLTPASRCAPSMPRQNCCWPTTTPFTST